MNYVGCANCNQRDFVMISNKTTVDEDGEEIVTYIRESWKFHHLQAFRAVYARDGSSFANVVFADMCKNCDHVIARHEYTFSVVDDYQVKFIVVYIIWLKYNDLLMLPILTD